MLQLVLTKQIVIVGESEPNVICNSTGISGQQDFDGVDIRFFRDLIDELGMDINEIEFKCVDWFTMFDRVEDDEVLCAFSCITIRESYLSEGKKFAAPYIHTGISVMIQHDEDHWQFTNVFSTELLLLHFAAMIFLAAPVVYLLERKMFSLSEYIFHEVGHLMINGSMVRTNYLAKVVDLASLSAAIVMVALYQAFVVQAYGPYNTITSSNDLSGAKMGSWSDYQNIIEQLGGSMIEMNINNPYQVKQLFETSNVDCVFFDDDFLRVAQWIYDDLYIVVSNAIEIEMGIMFSNATNDALISRFSKAILAVNERYPFDQRLSDFLREYYPKTAYLEKKPLIPQSYGVVEHSGILTVYAGGLAIGSFIGLASKLCTKLQAAYKNRSRKRSSSTDYLQVNSMSSSRPIQVPKLSECRVKIQKTLKIKNSKKKISGLINFLALEEKSKQIFEKLELHYQSTRNSQQLQLELSSATSPYEKQHLIFLPTKPEVYVTYAYDACVVRTRSNFLVKQYRKCLSKTMSKMLENLERVKLETLLSLNRTVKEVSATTTGSPSVVSLKRLGRQNAVIYNEEEYLKLSVPTETVQTLNTESAFISSGSLNYHHANRLAEINPHIFRYPRKKYTPKIAKIKLPKKFT
jgi:ABC-type amino acid transport substrate-binding protein